MNQSFQILCILVRIYAYVIIIRVPGLHCSKLDTDCIETLEYRVAAMVCTNGAFAGDIRDSPLNPFLNTFQMNVEY